MLPDYTFLPETIDELGAAQARVARLYTRLLGIEEESREAREAYLRLQTALTMRYAETAREWQRAKADVRDVTEQLDRMLT